MSSVILIQISAQSTPEFHININSMLLNPSIIMSAVKFFNQIISTFQVVPTESRAMLLNFSLVMEFLINVFTNFIFEKLLSDETLVTPRVTAIRNNLYK